MGEAKRKQYLAVDTKPKAGKKNNLPKFKIAVSIAVLLVSVLIVTDHFRNPSEESPLTAFDEARSIGNPEAGIKIVEFIDYQCHECAQGSEILSEYLGLYRDQIFLIVKYFSLDQKFSRESALYAQCAARQDKYWDFHYEIFESQHQWKNLPDIKAYFDQLGAQIRINLDEWHACVERVETKRIVEQEKILGEAHGVQSTPTYFINGEMFVGAEALRGFLTQRFRQEE
jgi:protein-disulfide isomerase